MATSDCITIPLTRGYSTVIDATDSDLASLKWNTHQDINTCYADRTKQIAGKKSHILMHRVILSRMLGRDLLPSERVDHIDLDGLNNRRGNLRLANGSQNQHNRGKQSNNTTGFKGVFKNGKGYMARIRVKGKKMYLGTYATPELAARAYDEAAAKYHGEFAKLNNVD